MKLTSDQVQFFEEQGFLTPIDVHDDQTASRFRAAFDELEAREGQAQCEIGLQGRHIDQRFIWELNPNQSDRRRCGLTIRYCP